MVEVQCHGGGETSEGSVPTFTEPSEIRTLPELQDLFHRGVQENPAIDPLAVALSLVDLGRSVEENDIVAGRRPVFTIATALFAALREITRPYPLVNTDEAPFMVCPPAAEILVAQAGGVFSDDYVDVFRRGGAAGSTERADALRLNMIWTLAENGIFQGNMFTRIAAALVLTGLSGYRELAPAPERTDDLFRRHIGLSAYDYVLILFGLWSFSLHDSLISLTSIIQDGPRKEELTRETAKVVAALARRVDRFRDLADAPSFATYTGKALPSAVFQRWPLIQLNDDQFVVSAHPFPEGNSSPPSS